MASVKKIPLRMCIACKQMKPKKEMLRIVKNSSGEVFVDTTGKAAGRGAYICTDELCAKQLKKAKLLNKVFSCEILPETYDKVEEELIAKK